MVTKEEMIATCIAREIGERDFVAHGLATPLALSGIFLAKKLKPNVTVGLAIGVVLKETFPIDLYLEKAIDKAIYKFSFLEAVTQMLPGGDVVEFFRPAQCDVMGNFNNVVIGDYKNPKLRLPGAAGIPEVTECYKKYYLYVPRHKKYCFVEKVDFVSGTGKNLKKVITDLCVFEMKNKRLELESIHSYTSFEEVQENTSFKLKECNKITPEPTEKELKILREIDPMKISRLETLSSRERIEFVLRWLNE